MYTEAGCFKIFKGNKVSLDDERERREESRLDVNILPTVALVAIKSDDRYRGL